MTSDKKIDILWKAINKQARYIEQLEIMVAHLKKDSHPPMFKKSQYKDLVQRLEVVEAWIDNIELIDKGEFN
tara:strand:+ start:1094 stop:1309 length:216 start_codon:yes stop_codon:yes gene_type:complete